MTSKSTLQAFARHSAIPLVLLDVPKHGIEIQCIFFLSKPNFLKASMHTIKAKVLSNPPDKPNTTFSIPALFKR